MAEIILNKQFSLDNSKLQTIKEGKLGELLFHALFSLTWSLTIDWVLREKYATSLPCHTSEFKKGLVCLQFLYRKSHITSCGCSKWSDCLPLLCPPLSTLRFIVLKISAVGAAKASTLRMTGLNLELRTPIIITDMQSLPLIIYSMLSGLSDNHFSHSSCCSFRWWRQIILFMKFVSGWVNWTFVPPLWFWMLVF